MTRSVDVKKGTAGDKELENGDTKTRAVKSAVVKSTVYVPKNPKNVKRGFVKMFVDFVVKRGTASADDLVKEFAGRQVANKKISKERVLRYISWCVAHGVLKTK